MGYQIIGANESQRGTLMVTDYVTGKRSPAPSRGPYHMEQCLTLVALTHS